ncbi:MAG: hypothetical protein LBB89_01105 [Treponema sp.]|jgi:hypothetical protein|nr:hypothetical protein [Treponema sp.]
MEIISIIIIYSFINLFSFIYFYYKFSNDIIDLLKRQGFSELSNRMKELISTGGKFPLKGSLEAKSLNKAWQEFIKLKINKSSGKLYKLQCFYKFMHLSLILNGILFLIPILILVIYTIRIKLNQ